MDNQPFTPKLTRNYRLFIQYDGTRFSGWQVQTGGRTVQGDIELALSDIFRGQKITLIGSGRTDAGVHALEQVANIHLLSDMAPSTLRKAVNSKLQKDVRIFRCDIVPDEFHARFSAISRSYQYQISEQFSPFTRNTHWFVRYKLDPGRLSECAEQIIGECEFTAFCKAGAEVNHKWCIVLQSEWEKTPDALVYRITANRFLHHMVRFLVGTMVEIARGRMSVDDFSLFLEGGHPDLSVVKAPAKGLFLTHVKYQV